VLFSKSAFGHIFGSEAPDSMYSLQKTRKRFFVLRRIIYLNNIVFSFLPLSLRKESGAKKEYRGRGFDSPAPINPYPTNDRGRSSLGTPPWFAKDVDFF